MPGKPLSGKVALVAGGDPGRGPRDRRRARRRGRARVRHRPHDPAQPSEYGRPETIEETAELVAAAGGTATAVAVDHLDAAQVARPGGAHRA